MKILAVLDTMWGDSHGRRAPRYFKINPRNRSGGQLLKMTEGHSLTVTNCAPVMTDHANKHEKHDGEYLLESLRKFKFDAILVCGGKAHETYHTIAYRTVGIGRVIKIPHPASRNFPNTLREAIKNEINNPTGLTHFKMKGRELFKS